MDQKFGEGDFVRVKSKDAIGKVFDVDYNRPDGVPEYHIIRLDGDGKLTAVESDMEAMDG